MEQENYEKELSYKEMCEAMGDEESKSGNVRKYQLEHWRESYDVEKVGRGKYIIHRALSSDERQMVKDRKNYTNFLQATLLDFVASSQDVTSVYTYKAIREHLYMVNNNYYPVKYTKEQLDLKLPSQYPDYMAEEMKQIWFNTADAHDEAAIKYALRKLADKRLISLKESHVFYKQVQIDSSSAVLTMPVLATDEQESKFLQVGIDYLNGVGCKTIKDLYGRSKQVQQGYFAALDAFVRSMGYTSYAKAFVVTRAYELKRVAKFFAPEFNQAQVDRYLHSKRFNVIPKVIHKQLVDRLIEMGDKKEG